jgi:glucose-6-phosphate dehydrogenase assembly protein OpcA
VAPVVTVSRIAGIPERADVGAIEHELHRLWASLDGETDGAGENAPAQVTLLCTLTLVAVVRNGRAADVAAIAERIGGRYPSRSLIVDVSPRKDEDLTVETALHCHSADIPGRPTVCCEQITVTAFGRAVSRVPGLVLPLLVTDMPVYVWWIHNPPAASDPEADLLRRLAEVADVVIVDSSAMDRPVAGLAAAAAIVAPLSGGIRDLTWGRLTPWRDLVVQCFDPPPMRQALERLDRIQIRTESRTAGDAPGNAGGAAPEDPIAGLLLGGWLAGRLGWEPAGPARRDGKVLRALFWRGGGGLELALEGGAGPVTAFECTAGGAEPCAVSVTRQAGDQPAVVVETRLGRARPRSHAGALVVPDDTALVAAELELSGVDQVLREALDMVLRVVPVER